MQKKLEEPTCKIVIKDGCMFLATPEGVILPRQLGCNLEDDLDNPAIATVKFHVNLIDTNE
jgi:hypothetical protein